VGEDVRHWCAAAGDEERERAKGESRARRMGVDFVFLDDAWASE
jgi:hypothetical protein